MTTDLRESAIERKIMFGRGNRKGNPLLRPGRASPRVGSRDADAGRRPAKAGYYYSQFQKKSYKVSIQSAYLLRFPPILVG